MAFRTMYPPQKDSPSTFLLGDISAVDTLMTVASAAALPQTLPYPLTIGIDKNLTETVMVIAQNLGNNQLTITRGTPAYAWVAGSKAARVLRATDFLDVQDNLRDVDTRLTTTQATVATHDTDILELETAVGDTDSGLVKGLADEITRATAAEGAEATRATAAEGNLDAIKVNRSELAQVITDWSYYADETKVLVTITRYNASTQQTTQYTRTLPIVSDENMGVMTPEAYAEITALRNDVNSLINLGGRFIGVSFATKAALNAYVVPPSVKNGDFTYVLDDETKSGATTRYVRNGSTWDFTFVIDYDPIGLANTTTAGIVKSKNEDGKTFVETDGTMSVVGWDTLKTRVTTVETKLIGNSSNKVARFVIGTSTAGWTAVDCDYLCDGTADQTEINAAITALPAAGGEIVILDGTYNITAKINVTKDNVSIRGNGNATMLKRMFNSSVTEGVITLTSRSGCKIANLQIDGNKTSYTNSNNNGIYLGSSSNNTVTGNTCNNNNDYDIYLNSSSNNTVTGNTCNNSNNYGIYLNSSSNNNTVTGNTSNSNNNGIYLNSSSNNTVTGNTCNNNNDNGIYLGSSSNNTVTGNTSNSNNNGILLNSSSNNNTVTGNTSNSNNNGILLNSSSNNNTVTGNTCNNNNDNGIYLSASSNNTVTGNTSNSNNNGIYLSASSNNTVTGNTCNNSNNYGIYLGSSSNNTVTGNTCIRGTGLTTDYTASQHTIRLASTGNNYNLIAMNNCMGKAVTNEGGTGNTLVNNKFDAT